MLKSRNNLIQSFCIFTTKNRRTEHCAEISHESKPIKKWRIEPGLLKDQNGCYDNFLPKILLNELYLSKDNTLSEHF